MKRILTDRLWTSFIQIACEKGNLSSYEDYYNSLVSWIIAHDKDIGDVLIERHELEPILYINPKKYIIESPPISLNMENNRLFSSKPRTIDSLIMLIKNTLWDLITISAEKNCPICTFGELRYFLAKSVSNNNEQIILECASCAWTENMDGTEWSGDIVKLYPINKEYLRKIGL